MPDVKPSVFRVRTEPGGPWVDVPAIIGPQGEQGPEGKQGPPVPTDTTLSKSGQAADAAKTGEAVRQLNKSLEALDTKVGGIDKLVGGGI